MCKAMLCLQCMVGWHSFFYAALPAPILHLGNIVGALQPDDSKRHTSLSIHTHTAYVTVKSVTAILVKDSRKAIALSNLSRNYRLSVYRSVSVYRRASASKEGTMKMREETSMHAECRRELEL